MLLSVYCPRPAGTTVTNFPSCGNFHRQPLSTWSAGLRLAADPRHAPAGSNIRHTPKISCIPRYPCCLRLPAYFTCLLVKNLLQKTNPPKTRGKDPLHKRHHKNPPVCITDMNPSVMPSTRALRIGYITHNPIKTIREDHPSQAVCLQYPDPLAS